MKMMNRLKKYAPRVNAVETFVGSGLLALSISVHAAVPPEVTTALGDAKTDAVTVAGLVLAIAVAIYGFTVIRRVMR